MISSRWPRPTFVIESIALIPVCSGSFTGWRSITPGAFHSSGRRSVDSIGPWPSSGLPSGSTTRPSSASPTGTEATSPVRRTGSPSLILSHGPKSATPTLSSSRLNARPTTPWSSSSISSATQFSSPWTRAMPSPSWSTAPTSARFVSTSNSSIRLRRIEVISSGRSFTDGLLYSYRLWRGRLSGGQARGEGGRAARARSRRGASSPAWRTIPPIRSGSTLRVACTFRPDFCSISATMRSNSASESS